MRDTSLLYSPISLLGRLSFKKKQKKNRERKGLGMKMSRWRRSDTAVREQTILLRLSINFKLLLPADLVPD
jgi:hypothetical protein